MKSVFWVAFLLVGFYGYAFSHEMLYTPGETQGINPNPKENNTWKSSLMSPTAKIKEADLFETGPDFFIRQYGEPFIFNADLIKKNKLETSGKYAVQEGFLEFNTGKKGWAVVLGAEPNHNSAAAIRLGNGWGKDYYNEYVLEMELEQDQDQTKWLVSKSHGDGKSWNTLREFRVKKGDANKFRVKLGWIAYPEIKQISGLRIQCTTPNTNVKLYSMRIVPRSGNCFWRRSFTLPFAPVIAKFSFKHGSGNYDLYINGQLVSTGDFRARSGILNFDITKYLKEGQNIIAYRDQFFGGLSQNPEVLLEGVAISRKGESFPLLGDAKWKWTFAAPTGWEKLSFNDAAWKTPRLAPAGINRMQNGRIVSTGFNPQHMGVLDISPKKQQYPVFDYNGDIEYAVKIPDGIIKAELKLEIQDADTRQVMETLEILPDGSADMLRTFTARLKLRKTGAYRMFWTLLSDGKEIDRLRGEMLIAGPIAQNYFSLNDFEKELDSRLELIQKIDCTDENPKPDTFLDHTGKYSKAKVNVGRVVERNGMRYRETGSNRMDYFCYKLDISDKLLGEAMIAEVILPDDDDRYLEACVACSFPVGFENNPSIGNRTWPNASGCASTGDFYPLSNGKKRLRFVFFPSSMNSTVMIQNGRTNIPAAACEINIYRVKGGLPALEIPKTDRLYANHNEQIIFKNWGAYGDPVVQGDTAHYNNYDGAWINAYRGIIRKIQWLRYQGHNASVEGAYMYNHGSISGKHSDNILDNKLFSYYHALLKMYKYNNIRQLVGFEYMRSDALGPAGEYDVTDDEIRAGTKRGIYTVDRYGKQVVGYKSMGLNFMSPVVWESVMDLLKEIYNSCDGQGNVEGLFVINGGWWLPGFTTYSDIEASEVGYDDDSVECFEKETGIQLGIPYKGADRFGKRYEALTGKYAKQWFDWRCMKLHEKLEEMRKVIQTGKDKWRLFAIPSKRMNQQHPFNTAGVKPQVRDIYIRDLFTKAGFCPDLYGKDKNDGITLVNLMPRPIRLENNSELYYYGMYTNKGTRKIYRDNDAVYIGSVGLNENIGTTASAAKKWWFRLNGVTVYDRKPVGDFAYSDMIYIFTDYVPKYIFSPWLDVNVATAHGDQSRRFLKAFYSVPRRDFKTLDTVKGIQAKFSGDTLTLLNATPYPLTGQLSFPEPFRDVVYDKSYDKNATLMIRPYTLLVFKTSGGDAAKFSGTFNFEKKIAADILLMGESILNESSLLAKIPPENINLIRKSVAERNVYNLKTEMDDFEVLFYAQRFFKSKMQMKNQEILSKKLSTLGRIGINCGSTSLYTGKDGTVWLPDQTYTGFNAYGNEYAAYASRGNIEMKNTDDPELFFTESYGGQVFYTIPLPKGIYSVKIYFAETWPPNKELGRKFSLTVNGIAKKDLNPVVLGGGFQCAASVTWDNIEVREGALSISGTGKVGINAIEIIKGN